MDNEKRRFGSTGACRCLVYGKAGCWGMKTGERRAGRVCRIGLDRSQSESIGLNRTNEYCFERIGLQNQAVRPKAAKFAGQTWVHIWVTNNALRLFFCGIVAKARRLRHLQKCDGLVTGCDGQCYGLSFCKL